MVYGDEVKEPEGRSAPPADSATRAAAVAAWTAARAARPPRPRRLKGLGVRHPLKHIRFISAARMAAYATLSGVGEATVVATLAAPDETERAEEGPAHVCGRWESEDGSLKCGYSSLKGRRVSMEDFYDIKSSKVDDHQINVFGVFDGHGGTRAAEYLKEHLFNNLLKHPAFITDMKSAISETYKRIDSDFLKAESNSHREDGSTASTAVFVGNHLYVANVGDSRAVLSKAGKAIPLSDDHKPNRSDEQERIENAGGFVTFAGTWRVGGVLAMSRAFGNRLLKKFVIADPEIQEQKIDSELEFLILASDGLWDVVSNEHAVAFVKGEDGPEAAAQKLTEIAFERGSTDNITCIVVEFCHDKMGDDSSQSTNQI